jgi:hypothetical protein
VWRATLEENTETALGIKKQIDFLQMVHFKILCLQLLSNGKGKAVPLQAWNGPEGSRKLRFLHFMTTAQDGGKVVSLTHQPPLPPRIYTWYSFMLEAESTPGP